MTEALTTKKEFGSTQLAPITETAASAAAAQARALVEARFVMALQRPRDLDDVRTRLLKECGRPGFAEVARFKKPVGGGKTADGLSIRFAEAAARCFTNIQNDTFVTYEDDAKRILKVVVADLESNLPYSSDIIVQKTVERRFLKEGQRPLSSRRNSNGDIVHLVEATEDDVFTKQNAMISKVMRTLILRIIPGDLQDEAEQRILETLRVRDKEDPDAARKKLVDSFASVGVMAVDLKKYLGHDIDFLSDEERTDLRAIFAAIKDGETTWRDVLDTKPGQPAAENDPSKSTTQNIADKIKATKSGAAKKGADKAADKATDQAEPGSTPAEPPSFADRSKLAENVWNGFTTVFGVTKAVAKLMEATEGAIKGKSDLVEQMTPALSKELMQFLAENDKAKPAGAGE